MIAPLPDKFDRADCIRWARNVEAVLGMGFHPDTPFADYIDMNTGAVVFADDEAERLDSELLRVDSYWPGGIYPLWELLQETP